MSPSRLNLVGVIVLVVGLSSAILLYWRNRPATSAAAGEWKDSTLSLTDSKANTHDIEMYGGKLEVLMVQCLDWLHRPQSQAILIASTATLVGLICFLLAARQRS